MRSIGHLLLLAVSAAASWWFLLHAPAGDRPDPPPLPAERELALLLNPAVAAAPPPAPAESPTTPPEPEPAPEPPALPGESAPTPPPPESGTPEGETEEPTPAPESESESEPAPAPETPTESATRELREIESTEPLMRRAEEEVSGESRKGFKTTFLCSAADQIAIARHFGEPIVLVPKAGLEPGRERYSRLVLEEGAPRIEEVRAAPPLDRHRQYRDLFAFSYESLPAPLRELRRRVFVRGDVYLFAALIPPREWGLVIVRREAALRESNAAGGRTRTLDDVRGFTMRYVRLPGGAFDIRVAEIRFADGSVWRPGRRLER